jgi:hypothetical protein
VADRIFNREQVGADQVSPYTKNVSGSCRVWPGVSPNKILPSCVGRGYDRDSARRRRGSSPVAAALFGRRGRHHLLSMAASVDRCQSIGQVSFNQLVPAFALPSLPQKVGSAGAAILSTYLKIWSWRLDSNPRRPACQAGRRSFKLSQIKEFAASPIPRYLGTSQQNRVGSVQQNPLHRQSLEGSPGLTV